MELNREEIIKSLECCEQSNCKECPSRGNCHELHSYALALIRELTETDAIEVVRCKDCIYWQEICKDPILNLVWGQCKCPESPYRYEEDVSSNDFCSYAYRRK